MYALGHMRQFSDVRDRSFVALREQSYGGFWLGIVAFGFIAYGCYEFAQSFWHRGSSQLALLVRFGSKREVAARASVMSALPPKIGPVENHSRS
jgi:hypothetical protein